MNSKRIVAKVLGAHGIKGELKIYPLVDDLDKLLELDELFIQNKKYKILSLRLHKNSVLVFLDSIFDRSSAELLKGYVEAFLEDDLKEGEFYLEDLKFMSVFDLEKNLFLGEVKSISDSGQIHLHIQLDKRFVDDFKKTHTKGELIIPLVEEYISKVDLLEKKIFVKLADDILELNL